MTSPGEQRCHQHRKERLVADCSENVFQQRRVLDWRKLMRHPRQGQQHQSQPDRDSPGIAQPIIVERAESHDPEQDQRRADDTGVERQHLRNQRGSDVGAQHHHQGGPEPDKTVRRKCGGHETRRGAALQKRRNADAGKKRPPPPRQIVLQPYPKDMAEASLDAGRHHMSAPKEQSDVAGELEQNDGPGHQNHPPSSGKYTRSMAQNSA